MSSHISITSVSEKEGKKCIYLTRLATWLTNSEIDSSEADTVGEDPPDTSLFVVSSAGGAGFACGVGGALLELSKATLKAKRNWLYMSFSPI